MLDVVRLIINDTSRIILLKDNPGNVLTIYAFRHRRLASFAYSACALYASNQPVKLMLRPDYLGMHCKELIKALDNEHVKEKVSLYKRGWAANSKKIFFYYTSWSFLKFSFIRFSD